MDARQARRILLVEDNSGARQSMRELLELWGHQVAPDGVQGVRMALVHAPDVALVDIGLPGLDGSQVAEALRSRVGNHIRLVALTGYGELEAHSLALKAGFDLHLTKPVRPADLERILSNL